MVVDASDREDPLTALLALAASWFLRFWWRGRRLAARRRHDLRAAVPDLLELLVVLLRAGLTPVLAFRELASLAPSPLREPVRAVVARVDAGERFCDALAALDELAPGVLTTVVGVLAHADRHGEPLAPILDRLGTEARQERRRAAEIEARRLPVRLCFPLVCCTLPAFVVLTIVPLLLGTFSSLTGLEP